MTSELDGFWKEKRVFVTGATGLVGSWVTKDLVDRGAIVTALVMDADPYSEFYRSGYSRRVHVINGSLEEFVTLERAIVRHECDTVIHLGAQAIVPMAQRAPLPTFEANIRGTYYLLEACRLHSDLVQRIVVASSDKAYGEQHALPYTEEMPLQGQQPYEVSKACADLIAQSYHQTFNLPVAVARCGNIYGGGDLNWTRIIPGTIRSLVRGESPVIRSDGRYIRDYIYVKDVSCGYLALAERVTSSQVRGQAYNFSPESRMTVLEVVERIQQLMNRADIQPTILDNAQGEIRSQYLSSAKAKETLGWRARYSFERGLRETIDWYVQFFREGLS